MGQAGQLRRLALIAAGGTAVYGALHYGDNAAADGQEPRSTRVPPQTRAVPAAAAWSAGPASLARLLSPVRENLSTEPSSKLFESMSWLPPPAAAQPQPPKKVVAEPPQAPPLPYRFVGMLQDRAKPVAFLSSGAELFIVSVGDSIEGQYRVDKLTPQEISLTYLPLNQAQQIRIGEE